MRKRRRIVSSFLLAFMIFEIIISVSFEKSAYAFSATHESVGSLLGAPEITLDNSDIGFEEDSLQGDENDVPEGFPSEKPEGEIEIPEGEIEIPELLPDNSEENEEEIIPEDDIENSTENQEEEPDDNTEVIPEEDTPLDEMDKGEETLELDSKSVGGFNAWEDLNKDGVVDNNDVQHISSKYNLLKNQPGFDENSDLNSDGIVDLYDLVKVSQWVGSDAKPQTGPRKIVLDPGHGGSDPGASGPNGTKEKDVVLKVALKVRDILKNKGYIVIMTRDGDYRLAETLKLDLEKRAQIANDNNADVFVSIHANSATSPTAHGTETFIHSTAANGSVAWNLANSVQSRLISELGLYNRGVKWADFSVLRNTKMPAVLTELAFINNPKEEALLVNSAFQDKAAKAIAEGIISLTK